MEKLVAEQKDHTPSELTFAVTGQFFNLRPFIRLAALKRGYYCVPFVGKLCGFIVKG